MLPPPTPNPSNPARGEAQDAGDPLVGTGGPGAGLKGLCHTSAHAKALAPWGTYHRLDLQLGLAPDNFPAGRGPPHPTSPAQGPSPPETSQKALRAETHTRTHPPTPIPTGGIAELKAACFPPSLVVEKTRQLPGDPTSWRWLWCFLRRGQQFRRVLQRETKKNQTSCGSLAPLADGLLGPSWQPLVPTADGLRQWEAAPFALPTPLGKLSVVLPPRTPVYIWGSSPIWFQRPQSDSKRPMSLIQPDKKITQHATQHVTQTLDKKNKSHTL